VHNLKNPDVLCNIAMNPHIYLMKDGTFEFEDEHGALIGNNYTTFREVKTAFYKYADSIFGIEPTDQEIPF
jgi:hypothetical protein